MCEGSGCYHSLKGRKENPTTVSLLKIKLNLIQRVKRQLFRNMISDKKKRDKAEGGGAQGTGCRSVIIPSLIWFVTLAADSFPIFFREISSSVTRCDGVSSLAVDEHVISPRVEFFLNVFTFIEDLST